jgi:hypothetical protein
MSDQQRAPRGLYFKAEDRPELKAKPKNPKVPDQYGIECNQRMRKLAKVLEDARAVVRVVDTLTSLDDAGLTISGIEHIEARIEFLVDSFQILSDDVEAAEARWQRTNPSALAEVQGTVINIQEDPANPMDRVVEAYRKRGTLHSPLNWGQAL